MILNRVIDKTKDKNLMRIVALILLIIINLRICIQYSFYEFLTDAPIANRIIMHLYVIIVLTVVVILNIIKIYKFMKNPDENKIKEYESKGVYGGKGKWLVLGGVVIEILLCVSMSKYFQGEDIFYPVFWIVFLAICFQGIFISIKNKIIKTIAVLTLCIIALFSVAVVRTMFYTIDNSERVSTRFELTDTETFGNDLKVLFYNKDCLESFLVQKEEYEIIYEEKIQPREYNFNVYSTKYKFLEKYLVRKAFGSRSNADDLYGDFTYADEVKELERDGVKVFYYQAGRNINTTYGIVKRHGCYLIYDGRTIIKLHCNYDLTENQMDIIIDSMKSMEEKL